MIDLLNYLEQTGFDTTDLKTAFNGNSGAQINALAAASKQETSPVSPNTSLIEEKKEEDKDAASDSDENAAKKKKQPKRPRDPNAPKRPLNVFLKFRNQEQKRIASERKEKGEPELSRADMTAAVKENWEKLSQPERDALDQECKEQRERYHNDLAAYKASNGASQTPAQASNDSPAQDPTASQEPVASQEPATSTPDEPAASQEAPLSQEALSQSQPDADGSEPPKKRQKKKDESKKKKKSKSE